MSKYITATEIRDRISNPLKYMSEYEKLKYLRAEHRRIIHLREALKPMVNKCVELLKERGLWQKRK